MLSLQARETIRHLLSPVIVPIHDAFDKAPVEDIRAHDPLPPYRTSLKVPSSFSSFLCVWCVSHSSS